MTELGRSARRVCVFGGTGFVGRHVAAWLAAQGMDVVVPTRRLARGRDLLLLPSVSLVPVARLDRAEMTAVLSGCDASVNLIGILNERGHNGAEFRRVHAELVENLVAACGATGVTRLIHVSALKANAEHGPSHYLRTKGLAERIINASATRGIRSTILRPSVIFGRDDTFINRFARLLRLAPFLPLARPYATFAPVHVANVAEAVVRTLLDETTIDQTYELCGPDTYTLLEIVTRIRAALGISRLIIPLPDVLGATQAFVCDYLVPGKPFSLDNYRSLSVPSTCSTNGLARLGIAPLSFSAIVAELEPRESRLTRFRRAAGR